MEGRIMNLEKLGNDLNAFNPQLRRNALTMLKSGVDSGELRIAGTSKIHNLHCHTFYSYNGYNFSPSYIAWLALKSGWFAAGIVDFDVLDAVNEFLDAAKLLKIRGVCGIETRAFVKELADKEINSPGEPGAAYHMGVGFTTSDIPESQHQFAAEIKDKAATRTRHIVELVNPIMGAVALDFDADVDSLTPAGNATERHLCLAYRLKAEKVFPDSAERSSFWCGILDCPPELVDDPVVLEAQIRAKTMKKGGPGYVKADPAAFPALEEMNAFTIACGALPTIAWLNGDSPGESDPGALLDLHIKYGAVLLNIIPDRNWNFKDSELREKRVNELNRIIAAAKERAMPIIVGTEMNAPGLKLADDFECAALKPHAETFVDGAAIAYAHTALQPSGRGYLSEWACRTYPDLASRNQFFAEYGRRAVN